MFKENVLSGLSWLPLISRIVLGQKSAKPRDVAPLKVFFIHLFCLRVIRKMTLMNSTAECVTSSSARCTTRRNISLEGSISLCWLENLNAKRSKMPVEMTKLQMTPPSFLLLTQYMQVIVAVWSPPKLNLCFPSHNSLRSSWNKTWVSIHAHFCALKGQKLMAAEECCVAFSGRNALHYMFTCLMNMYICGLEWLIYIHSWVGRVE